MPGTGICIIGRYTLRLIFAVRPRVPAIISNVYPAAKGSVLVNNHHFLMLGRANRVLAVQFQMDADRLAAVVEDGKVVRWSVDPFSPFMVFEPIPAHLSSSWILPLL